MHLADRGGGERLLVEVAEHPPERAAELLAHQLLQVREPHGRNVVAERRQAALQIVPLLLGEAVELDHRDHLADLHGGASHLPELLDQLLDQRSCPLAFGRRGALGRPHAVGGAHSRPAQALTRYQPSDPGRPREPAGRELARLRRILAGTHAASLAIRLEQTRGGGAQRHAAGDRGGAALTVRRPVERRSRQAPRPRGDDGTS